MDKTYKQAFLGLNAKQKQAVEQIDGPVLVIAGPGTGKTQLLSTRVAHILKITDTKPSNILCLSFTNKAAANMKSRIINLAGAEGARVEANTFHSFAGEIMNSYPDFFWSAASLSVAPESIQLDIIESIVSKLPLDNTLSLKFAGQYTLIGDIQRSINLAKDAGLTPKKLSSLISVNLAYLDQIEEQFVVICAQKLSYKNLADFRQAISDLPNQNIAKSVYPLSSLSDVIDESLDQAISKDNLLGKTTNTSAWKRRWVQTEDSKPGMFEERRRNLWWQELASVYEQYRELIHARGFYDYADMLVETISQLEQNPQILADIQERFSYVMIDEFQDTNPAQLRLAHLVADHHSANDRPNLMAVGDDDQSIFKFNGAELNNMLGFRKNYPTAKLIILEDNYRSTQGILDSSQRIISLAEHRLVNIDKKLSKKLVAVNPPANSGRIVARSYSSRELQLSRIGQEIKHSYRPNKTTAILARSHDSLIRMAGVLQQLGVPLRYEQQSNVLDHEIVQQIYLLMKLLIAVQSGDKQQTNWLLGQIIRHPLWKIEPRRLWELALKNNPGGSWLDSMLSGSDSSLKQVANWILGLSQITASQPLAVSLEQLLGLRDSGEFRSPIKDYFYGNDSANSNKYFRGLSAVQLLRSLVFEFSEQVTANIDDFVRFIEINRQNNKIVADESPFITGAHAVQLLTVHKAKGLEFDSVYIIDAIEDNWQPRKGGRKPPANLPLRPAQDDFDDFVRLMYVAATRAKSSLSISSYYQNHAGKEVAPSSITQTVFKLEQVREDSVPELTAILEQSLTWPSLSGGLEKEFLKARLETYNLSVTHLLNFLDVTRGGPQNFKDRNLLRLPEIKTISQAYGTAIHKALEASQKLQNQNGFSLPKVQKAFSLALKAEQVPESDFKRYLPKGYMTLERLFTDFGYKLPKSSLSEQNFQNIQLDRALISGKLDRIDKINNSLRIIDYKTGRPLTSLQTVNQSEAIKAYKHKLQLIFYSLLATHNPRFSSRSPIECQMVYVEAQISKKLVLAYSPTADDIARLKSLIEAVWLKIMTLDLPDTSSYSQDIAGIMQFEADLIANK